MIKLTTWLKRTGGVLLACLLLAFVVTPAVDAAICGVEPAAAISTDHADADPAIDHAGDQHGKTDADACLHGHCHHASPLIGVQTVQTGAHVMAHARLTPAGSGLPPSLEPDRLNKPPRA